MNLILFLAGVFLVTFVVGRLLEKIKIPWIFSSLLIGLGLAAYNPFKEITSSESFIFLAQLGMYFLLFIIGFEMNLDEIRKKKKFIIKTTLAIISAEAFFGTFFVHYIFDVSWFISILVALSFATVGEAVLLPILDEFKLTKTRLGQTILGIGVLDDIVEVATIIVMTVLLGTTLGHANVEISVTLAILVGLFASAYLLTKLKKRAAKIHFEGVASFFIFVVFFIFAFIGIGLIAEAAALGALLAGMALRNFIPKKRWNSIDSEIRTMAYGFFAPMFFLWVGLDADVYYLIKFPLLVVAVVVLANTTKIITSYLMGRKELGTHRSIILGVSLTVKFSTSIVIIKLLFEKNLIPLSLYSVLIGSTILFKFFVPFLLSHLIKRWKIKS
ncbi:MAG: cation:proton antiporter [Nanoarchaeota archaeon]|nr:cation:proton antiporter [Nanoarchaeota archaeon]MBU1632045.1 cation:proton antiporter [Nanoarchaeota archaeon]MBU1875536.1 cation:proton antiporter [Nanoarchaeota archaeon]